MTDESNEVISAGSKFLHTLSILKGGVVLEDIGTQLTEVVKSVHETGKVGSLILTFKIAPAEKDTPEIITIECDVKERIPKPSRGKTVLFVGAENFDLTRDNPRQKKLFNEGAAA